MFHQGLPVKDTIYYLPGYGGRLSTGLGKALLYRGLSVSGRETVGDFRVLPFTEQVKLVAADLRAHFWSDQSRVIANSFGGYLFLHAQATLPAYPGRVLILSPIVGEFGDESTGTYFSPPHADTLRELAESGAFPTPSDAQIHVGELDWQSVPENVKRFGEQTNIPVTVVPGAGPMLDHQYVGDLLDRWLAQ